MKRSFVVLVAGMFVYSLVPKNVLAGEKFAYVNLMRVFSEYNKTKDYDKGLTDKEDIYTKEREKKVNEIKQLQEKMNLLSDKEKEATKSDFEAKIKALQDFDTQKQTDLRKEQNEKMKEIMQDIEEVVRKYAQKEGITFVLNDRAFVYQDKSYDISDKIITTLNNNYKK
ncbi:MAG: OmpH family outer membrane protein [Candidatus Omnitrophica bacterium]|nr:OmpH family outer membrane protein [Candidatus Omnitrophota bacterium]